MITSLAPQTKKLEGRSKDTRPRVAGAEAAKIGELTTSFEGRQIQEQERKKEENEKQEKQEKKGEDNERRRKSKTK